MMLEQTKASSRIRMPLIAGALSLLLGLVALGALSAQSQGSRQAKAKPGASLFGLVLQGYNPTIDAAALRQANPDSVRILLAQGLVQTGAGPCTAGSPGSSSVGGGCNWGQIDQEIGGAAQAGAQPLPFFFGESSKPPLTGKAAQSWKAFLTAAVKRYRPGGVYWNGAYQAQYPGNKAKPIKVWQVWNEPGSPTYFKPKPNIGKYVKLLKTAGQTINRAHKGARIMIAGLFASPDKGAIRGRIPAVQFLEKLYQIRGARTAFDIAAVHPYSRTVSGVIKVVEELREVMRKNGDGGKPLAITELGWSSNKPNNSLLAKGIQGQRNTLRAAFSALLRVRTRYHLDTVNWFSLRDAPKSQSSCPNCPFAGLNRVDGGHKPAWGAFLSFT
jgi:hypothetical protein